MSTLARETFGAAVREHPADVLEDLFRLPRRVPLPDDVAVAIHRHHPGDIQVI